MVSWKKRKRNAKIAFCLYLISILLATSMLCDGVMSLGKLEFWFAHDTSGVQAIFV